MSPFKISTYSLNSEAIKAFDCANKSLYGFEYFGKHLYLDEKTLGNCYGFCIYSIEFVCAEISKMLTESVRDRERESSWFLHPQFMFVWLDKYKNAFAFNLNIDSTTRRVIKQSACYKIMSDEYTIQRKKKAMRSLRYDAIVYTSYNIFV